MWYGVGWNKNSHKTFICTSYINQPDFSNNVLDTWNISRNSPAVPSQDTAHLESKPAGKNKHKVEAGLLLQRATYCSIVEWMENCGKASVDIFGKLQFYQRPSFFDKVFTWIGSLAILQMRLLNEVITFSKMLLSFPTKSEKQRNIKSVINSV